MKISHSNTQGEQSPSIFELQKAFQQLVTDLTDLPTDNVTWSSYHMLGLTEEVGELIKSDKRWKTHRNEHFDKENKLEELSDVIICAINVAIFSGFTGEQLQESVVNKIFANTEKLKEARRSKNGEDCSD